MKNLILGLFALVFLMGAIATGTGSASVAIGVGVIVLAGAFIPKMEQGVAYSKIDPDVSALAGYAGKYSKDILLKFENALDFFKDLHTLYNVKSSINLTKLNVNGKPKPFTGVFAAQKGDIVYSGNKLEVEKWQRDFAIMPDNYRGTYLEDLRKAGEGANNMNFPSHVYDAVTKKLAGDINDIVPWWGVGISAFATYSAAATYTVGSFVKFTVNDEEKFFEVVTATVAGENPTTHPAKFIDASTKAIAEGVGTKIRKGRTSGDITRVASTGIITAADAEDQFRAVWAKLPEWIRRNGGKLYCSFSAFELFLHAIREYTKYTQADTHTVYLPLTNKKCEIVPATWITDSNMIVATTKDNLLVGTDMESDYRDIRAIPQMYHLDFGMTGVLGFGVQDFDSLATNDQN